MNDLCNWPTCGCHTVNGSPWCKASFTAAPVDQITVAMALPAVRALISAAHCLNEEVIMTMGAKRSSLVQPSRSLTAALAPFGKATE